MKKNKSVIQNHILKWILMFFIIISVISESPAWSAPNLISYQGIMLDAKGKPVDGSVNMTLSVYDIDNGGIPLWSEDHVNVPLDNGTYHVLLGNGTTTSGTFDAVLFSGNVRWLEVVVGGLPLTPRTRITSTAYSLNASNADNANDVFNKNINPSSVSILRSDGIPFNVIDNNGQWMGAQITGAQILDSTITSSDIQNNSISSDDIGNDEIVGAKVRDGSLTGLDIKDGSISSDDIGSLQVTESKIAAYAITGDKIKDGEVKTDDIGNLQVTEGKISDNAVTPAKIAHASANQVLTSDASGVPQWVNQSSLNDSDWTISGNNMYSGVSGNVGIGTTDPGTRKLKVAGDIEATGKYYGDGSGLTGIPGDNLGNHTASQNIKLNGHHLSGDGDNEGIYVTNDGYVKIGTSDTNVYKLTVNGNDGALGQGIKGEGSSVGVRGYNTVAGYGVFGTSNTNFSGIGVGGRHFGGGIGVEGQSNSGVGVDGISNSSIAVRGKGGAYDFYAFGPGINYGAASSIRWKKNIQPIDNALNKVLNLRGVYFDWDEGHGGHHDMGMIAEEVGEYIPEIVNYEEDGIYAEGMDYGALTPVLVEAIKGQQSIIESQQREIEQLKALVCLDHSEAEVCQ